MEELTKEAVADTGVTGRNILRSKNMFALGLISWIFGRPVEPTLNWLQSKFKDKALATLVNLTSLGLELVSVAELPESRVER